MDLAYPCFGYLDDGLFDLGLEDNNDNNSSTSKLCHSINEKGKINISSWNNRSDNRVLLPMISSPDTVDLALLGFAGSADEKAEGDTIQPPHQSRLIHEGANQYPQKCSFCDVKLSGIKESSLESGLDLITKRPSNQRGQEASVNGLTARDVFPDVRASVRQPARINESSPVVVVAPVVQEEQSPRSIGRRNSLVLPSSHASDPALLDRSSTSDGHRSDNRRSASRSFRRQFMDRSLVDTNAASRWAREKGETSESVATDVRKEEQEIADSGRLGSTPTNSGQAIIRLHDCGGCSPSKRRVSFTAEVVGAQDIDDNDEWDDVSDAGVHGRGGQDLLARASELHSSVAGQLRSVNELLQRKSYFYIDTSWCAKQLPCPPKAWKGRRVAGGSGSGGGTGSTVEAHPAGVITSPIRRRPHASSNINVHIRLEGQWVSGGSKRQRVGIHSIPGKKV